MIRMSKAEEDRRFVVRRGGLLIYNYRHINECMDIYRERERSTLFGNAT